MWCIVLHARQVMKTHLEQAATGARSLVAIGEESVKQGAGRLAVAGVCGLGSG